jgi:hypothetical protein
MDTNTKVWIIGILGVGLAANAGWEAITKDTTWESKSAPVRMTEEKVLDTKQYTIPSGALGNVFFNELVAMRKAASDGDDAEAARLVRRGQRKGAIVVFNKNTTATLTNDLGEYLQLQPVGATEKFWFGKNQVSPRK